MFGNHGLCGLPEESAYEKFSKYLGGNLGDFGEFCKGLNLFSSLSRRKDKVVTGIKKIVLRAGWMLRFGVLLLRSLWCSVRSHYDISNSKKVV